MSSLPLPDYRTLEQKAIDTVRKYIVDEGYVFTVKRRQSLAGHSEVEGTLDKEGVSHSSLGMASGTNRFRSLLLAEVDCIKNCLISFGVSIEWEKIVAEKIKEEVEEGQEEVTIDGLSYEGVFRCTSIKEVYSLLKGRKDLYLRLEKYQDSLVSNGQRLTVPKAADYLFPKRQARRKWERSPKEEVLVETPIVTVVERSVKDMHQVAAVLIELNIEALNYVEKVGKEIAAKYPTFEAFCKTATDGDIRELHRRYAN